MIFYLLTPPQGPRGRGQKQFAVARPIHVSNSHTKFGWISSNGLGIDSIKDRRTDRRMDGGDYNIPFAFLKKRGDNKLWLAGKGYDLYCFWIFRILIMPFTSKNSSSEACWVIFQAFVIGWLFSKLTFSKKSFRNTIRVSNSFDSGSKLFTKVISIRQRLPIARKEFFSLGQIKKSECFG